MSGKCSTTTKIINFTCNIFIFGKSKHTVSPSLNVGWWVLKSALRDFNKNWALSSALRDFKWWALKSALRDFKWWAFKSSFRDFNKSWALKSALRDFKRNFWLSK